MRAVFMQELGSVQDRLVEISGRVLDAMRDASTAFNTADIALADRVIAGDAAIDELAVELDELSIDILARQSPVARDLRIVVSALRISAMLERMGDLARHIAQLARRRYPERVVPHELNDTFIALAAEATHTAELINRLLRTQQDAVAAQVIEHDDEIDELHQAVLAAVRTRTWSGDAEQIVDLTLAGRFYERFGDQAVMIARKMQYLATGEWAPAKL